MQIDKVLISE